MPTLDVHFSSRGRILRQQPVQDRTALVMPCEQHHQQTYIPERHQPRRTPPVPRAPPPEFVAVAPSGQFARGGLSNPDQIGLVPQAGQPHVLRLHTQPSVPEESLRCLNGFPSFLQRGQVPPRTLRTDCPQTALPSIKGEALADRKRFKDLVPAEVGRAEYAVAVYGLPLDERDQRIVIVAFRTVPSGCRYVAVTTSPLRTRKSESSVVGAVTAAKIAACGASVPSRFPGRIGSK